MSIPYGDIRDLIRKLSKIATNFWAFCAVTNFVGGTPRKLVFTLPPRPPYLVKFRKVAPTTTKVIDAHVWNFKPNFKCSALTFWGQP